MNHHTPLDTLVRHCDPAASPLTDAARARQEALLRRLLSEPQPASPVRRPPRPRSVVSMRWLAPTLILLLLVGTVAGIGLDRWGRPPEPTRVDGQMDPMDQLAGWRPEPSPAQGADAADVDRVCLDDLRVSDAGRHLDPAAIKRLIMERRGPTYLAVYSLPESHDYTCLTREDPGQRVAEPAASSVMSGVRTDVAPDQISRPFGSVGYGFTSVGRSFWVWGAAGPRVRQVTIRSHEHTLDATVSNGYYAAWWPVRDDARNPLRETPHFDLTLDDGTVLSDAQPLR